MSSSTPPPTNASSVSRTQPTQSNGYFEKQRDLLVQDISSQIDSVLYNLEVLNRSLHELIQVGKEFDDVGRLWSHFYDGAAEVKSRNGEASSDDPSQENEAVALTSDEEETESK